MNTQELKQLPAFVQYLIIHGIVNHKDTAAVEAATKDAIKYNLSVGDLWRISTDRGMAS